MTTNKQYTIDLHTHSIVSYDGGINAQEYKTALESGFLDVIAVTDHNQIAMAQSLHKTYGDRIIVGEEIMTLQGEVIGLYLSKNIPSGLTLTETLNEINLQHGLVYVPHPFEKIRRGITISDLKKVHKRVDILETFNGRARFQGSASDEYAQKAGLAKAASSDAHMYQGLGSTLTFIPQIPTRSTLVKLLQKGILHKRYPPLYTLLAPTVNKLRHLFVQES